jgi:acetyl-CoA carboxylase biotin carboxylase subunit
MWNKIVYRTWIKEGIGLRKLLIANRGEIATRIIRTCGEMGIEPVIVYSDADKNLPYVRNAKISYCIGESASVKSYLNVEKILEIAQKESVDAIHPGYGFLSENSEFVHRTESANINFIGPSAHVVELMGDKVKAREAMKKNGIPVIPGSDGIIDNVEDALELAETIGYPVMVKASTGGGGIGIQRCDDGDSLSKAFQSGSARAKAYFGSGEMFLEKYIPNSRHIEVQIFGDKKGKVVHIFERDCSIQRRHQKVIEESPSPFLSKKAKEQLCHTAVKAAHSVGYTNAGTVEFIVDEYEQFYFLEMNTRLQVEHPVTEMVTGLDLVRWQIEVAAGRDLPLVQKEIEQHGHSIEFRLYAEDPITFRPSPGKLLTFSYPEMDGVRVETGYEEGSQITPFYDPMIAKIVVAATTRAQSISKAASFFKKLQLTGIKHNAPLFIKILKDNAFQQGDYTTSFLY